MQKGDQGIFVKLFRFYMSVISDQDFFSARALSIDMSFSGILKSRGISSTWTFSRQPALGITATSRFRVHPRTNSDGFTSRLFAIFTIDGSFNMSADFGLSSVESACIRISFSLQSLYSSFSELYGCHST